MNVLFRRSGKVGMVSNGLLVLYEISTFYILYLLEFPNLDFLCPP